ncbi:unnamed protein product [Rotaria sp. Silwood1]|nr:unnamed protein product [Rotaria sp. Silwood1]
MKYKQLILKFCNPKCFSGDDFVSMANGEKKILRELRPGDRVLVMNSQKQIEEDEVIMMLDSQPNRPALFYSIETETGHRLSLTGNHFIAVNHNDNFLPANQIKTHDIVLIYSQGKLQSVKVRNVSEEYKVGYFTPMTSQGTLIVNDLAASCYSSVVSHNLAHQMLAPLRWWYRFAKLFAVEHPYEYVPNGGIHWLPKAMLQITEKYLPSVLTTEAF